MHGHTTFNKINRHAARLMRHGIFGPGRNFVRRCLTIKCPTFYRQCLILAGSRQNFRQNISRNMNITRTNFE